MFDINPVTLIYIFAAISTILFVEAAYLMFFSTASYKTTVNRRMRLLQNEPNRENILVQLRRERSLTSGGDYAFRIQSFNRLMMQSGVTIGLGKFAGLVVLFALIVSGVMMMRGFGWIACGIAALFCCTLLPLFVLRFLRARRHKKFGLLLPDAIDVIVRSLRAGHPVPIAIQMVGREMPDPVGSEFGMVADEITYGADLETALRNMYYRVGQEDMPLFVTAVAIQGSTGGNLSEILGSLSAVIRLRFKMRRKIKALAAEGRFSALLLSSLPIAMFLVLQFMSPEFYGSVWHIEATKIALGAAGAWMLMGNLIMYKMINFKV
ncbi:MAG TPA: type II secretion system F family protein [Xanthobacteraceae bacterium]|jgi:tight adherence protein B|nr:type II secretion system F family protein [Xanthobacteraceae bacterium]